MTYLPFGLSFWILLLAAALMLHRSRYGRPLTAAAALGLFLWSWPPFAWVLAGTLEPRSLADPAKMNTADAMVVVSGGVYQADASEPETLPTLNTYLRCHYAAWIYRHVKPLPVLVSGGPVRGEGPVTLGEVMKQTMMEAGVPSDMISVEGRSESTYQNALFSAGLLQEKGRHRVVVVTEGYHMRRTAACFRKQGLEVVPAPVANRTARTPDRLADYMPSTAAMVSNEDILHEWAGLAWYWISGKL